MINLKSLLYRLEECLTENDRLKAEIKKAKIDVLREMAKKYDLISDYHSHDTPLEIWEPRMRTIIGCWLEDQARILESESNP